MGLLTLISGAGKSRQSWSQISFQKTLFLPCTGLYIGSGFTLTNSMNFACGLSLVERSRQDSTPLVEWSRKDSTSLVEGAEAPHPERSSLAEGGVEGMILQDIQL